MKKLLAAALILFLAGSAGAENGTEIENVSLSVEFNLSSSDEVYSDNTKISTGEFESATFPYIVSDSNEYVSGIVADSFLLADRTLEDRNRLMIRRKKEKSSFLVPLTYGSYFDVESREDMIISNSFLNQLSPSFGFFIPTQATVKTALDPNVTLESDIELGPGSHTLEIEKTGENRAEIRRED